MSAVVALIDGEHYPPVVRFALDELRRTHDVVAAAFIGGTEKVDAGGGDEVYGLPVVRGASASDALRTAIERFRPETVIDLSDEPVISAAGRFRLASEALTLGVGYRGPTSPSTLPRPRWLSTHQRLRSSERASAWGRHRSRPTWRAISTPRATVWWSLPWAEVGLPSLS